MIDTKETLYKFNDNLILYNECKSKIENLVTDLLKDSGIGIHNISSRVKTEKSFSDKITLNKEKYDSINDITDIVGIRIITYLENDVDKVADLIKKEFNIDDKNSIDKREIDYDRFGYASLHYVVQLNDSRSKLPEYKKICTQKVEIQIKSILQHSWAEIEHDLGYKNKESIPTGIKRNFARLSALLEVADIEFIRIKELISDYVKEIPEQYKSNPSNVDINKNTLAYFLSHSEIVNEIENEIAEPLKITITDEPIFDEEEPIKLKYCGFSSIGEIELAMIKCKDKIIDFAFNFLKELDIEEGGYLSKGFTIQYLQFYLIADKDLEYIKNYLKIFIVYSDINETANFITKTYSKMS